MGGPVVVRALELQHDIAATVECQSFVGIGGAQCERRGGAYEIVPGL